MALVWRNSKSAGGDASWEKPFKKLLYSFSPFVCYHTVCVSFIVIPLSRVLQDCDILTPSHPPLLKQIEELPT
jgi:hypothetical protein